MRTSLPLAYHIRAMLASGHEDFVGGSRPGRTARPEDAGNGKATECLLNRLVHTAHRIELTGKSLRNLTMPDLCNAVMAICCLSGGGGSRAHSCCCQAAITPSRPFGPSGILLGALQGDVMLGQGRNFEPTDVGSA